MIKVVRHFESNNTGRDFVVGDLHGCYNEFLFMLEKIGFDISRDRMFSVGDLVDRGKDSLKCLELIYTDWFHTVIGNHEKLMVDIILYDGTSHDWVFNGGSWYYKEDLNELKIICQDLVDSSSYIITVGDGEDRFNVVHAEFYNPIINDEKIDSGDFTDQSIAAMIWGRSLIGSNITEEKRLGLSKTYVGHTPVPEAVKILSHVYIDTGAVFGGCLTMVEPKINQLHILNMKDLSYNIQTI